MRRLKYMSSRLRSKNKLARGQSRTSSSKILLGGLVLGMAGLLLYQFADHSLKFPLHLFVVACLAACLVIVSRGYERRTVPRLVGHLQGFCPLILAIGCCLFAIPRFQAQHLFYTNSEKLQSLLNEPDRIFENPGELDPIEEGFSKAVELLPGHAEAWIELAECRLARLHAEVRSPEEIARTAEGPLIKAGQITSLSWRIHYSLARVASIQGKPISGVMDHLELARQLAPRRPEPDAFLGILLLMEDRESVRGQELLRMALNKYPEYELLHLLQPWLALSNGQRLSGELPTLNGSLVTPPVVARQFVPLPVTRERVRAAGLPVGY